MLVERTKFPYKEININKSYDFFTVESLKEHYCTLYEGDVIVQHYDCYIRVPRKPTKLYKFKIYDEAMAAPMSLFFPKDFMFEIGDSKKCQNENRDKEKDHIKIIETLVLVALYFLTLEMEICFTISFIAVEN